MKIGATLGVLLLQVVTSDGISVSKINNELDKVENEIDNKLFLYETPSYQWIPSSVYKYADLRESLDVMATEGVAGKKFYIGEDTTNGHVYGMVNIAAFLAQSMKETIKYDACDENSWDLVGGKYPLSNACGQLGQSYQDYHCSEEEKHMECPVDPNMSITAVTHAKWYGAPAPLYCGPKTDEQPFSGFWDYGYECNKSWANPPEYCDVYEGQKAGKFDQSRPYANTAGRTDVEGCCWWGRGVIQTTGVCNFGKLNYYLGARAAEEGRPSRYPTIDFCKDPEQICSSSKYKELKWVAGMFYWMESVQSYDEGGWRYMDELAKFVEGGMQGTGFIDAVSGIVNRGCHNPPCGTGALDGGHERSQNFKKVLETFFAGSPPKVSGSITTSNVDEPSNPSSPTLFGPSPPTQTNGDKWYPEYSLGWAEGKCLNVYPAPSGRPHYETQSECCAKAYGGQASGVCVGNIPSSPASTPSRPNPDVSGPIPLTPQPTRKPVSPSSEEGAIVNSEKFGMMIDSLDAVENEIDNKLFLYETPSYQWIPSSVYKYADLKESLYVIATEGVAGKKFYIGEDTTNGHVYGMVNIAAFLAQSMKETIKYDACDENSWDLVGGKYPLSNACGQLGQSYQDYHCSEEEKHMECPVDPNMSITAVTHAKWYGAPAPLYCGPKTDEQPFSGFWDYGYECNKSWANPPEYCDVYEDQKAGKFDQSRPYANTAGRTDVEGCCWWGRGVIQTTGVCNFGKLNYYLGARAAEEGRPSRYPTIDFCKDPEQICSSSAFKELKWVAGMFYWMESVQSYDEGGWRYMDELAKFVEGGMQGTAFIDAVSGIVNRGCHNPPCGTGALDGGLERSQNFKKVLGTFFAGSPPEVSGSSTTSTVDEPSRPSSPTSITPSSPSPPTQINGGDKWYADYASNWAEGECINDDPAPSGRPHYDSQRECCDKAYGGQASGVCVGGISTSSEENLSPTPDVVMTPQPTSKPQVMIEGPASPSQDLTTDTEASPQPPSSTVFVSEETLRPTNKPVASISIEEPGGRWYPDYNPIWALGQCINTSPAPSGRPNYESQSECCKKAYGGQASGACVGYTTATVSKLETYYPDYNGNWALGRCTNDYPAPSGRPQYTSQRECCEKAYGGQASGACMSDVALITTDALDEWYPNYDPLWSKGICTNKAPLPHGRPTYSSQSECCEFAYRGQASGACVNHSPGDTEGDNPVSFAESFSSEYMAPHAAVRSSFITYSCGESSTIPYDTAIMDILFDYEISLPQNVQASHILPSLKKQIMDSLATSLNCQLTQRRGLRKVEGVLLGFQSVDGSDVIDGDKASCIKSQQLDGEACYPVIGHIGAIMKFEASNDEVLFVKSDVLNNIRIRMETKSIVDIDSSGIKYVSEHDDNHEEDSIQLDDGDFQQEAQSGNTDDLTRTNNRSWIEVAFWLLGCVCGVGVTLAVIKRRERRRNNLIDSSDDDLPICLEVEDTDHTNDFSDRSVSSNSHDRGDCDSSSDESSEQAPHTHELQPQHEFKRGQTMSLDEYINETRACPSVFAAVDVVRPSLDTDQKIENSLDKQVEMDENDEEESNILKDEVQYTGAERDVLCNELNSSQREEVGDQQVERGDDKEEVESTHLPPVI